MHLSENLMVYLLDEGSVFDMPIDKVWKGLSNRWERQHADSLSMLA